MSLLFAFNYLKSSLKHHTKFYILEILHKGIIMPMNFLMKDAIEERLSLAVATPGFLISVAEQQIKNNAIKTGLREYFRYWPWRFRGSRVYKQSGEEIAITFEEIFATSKPRIPEEQQKHAYLLGVSRLNNPSWNQMSNPNMWDRQLLGVQISANNFNPLTQITYETYEDLSRGQAQLDFNTVDDTIYIMAPFGLGNMILDFAVGFDDPQYVPASREEWLCDLIEYRFLQAIITMRSSVSLDADFTISVEAMKARCEVLLQKIEEMKKVAYSHLAQWS